MSVEGGRIGSERGGWNIARPHFERRTQQNESGFVAFGGKAEGDRTLTKAVFCCVRMVSKWRARMRQSLRGGLSFLCGLLESAHQFAELR